MKKIELQKGAVWVEFLVASSTVLLSMFFLIPMLAKYTDIRHSTEQAARYSAWERTVWHGPVGEYNKSTENKSSLELENEINHRVLGSGGSLIYNTQGSVAELANLQLESFHNFNNLSSSKYEVLFNSNSAGGHKYFSLDKDSAGVTPGGTALLRGTLDSLFPSRLAPLRGGVPVEKKGYYTDEVSIKAKVPAWITSFNNAFPGGVLKFSASNSILVDGWGAGGVQDNKDKVNAMRPVTHDLFSGVVKSINVFYAPYPWFTKEELSTIDVEKVDVDQLLEGEDPTNPDSHLGVY